MLATGEHNAAGRSNAYLASRSLGIPSHQSPYPSSSTQPVNAGTSITTSSFLSIASNSSLPLKRDAVSASTLLLIDTARPREAAKKRRESLEGAAKAQAPTTSVRGQATAGSKLRSKAALIVENRERHELLNHLRAFKEAETARKREEIARVAAMAVNMQLNGCANPMGHSSTSSRLDLVGEEGEEKLVEAKIGNSTGLGNARQLPAFA